MNEDTTPAHVTQAEIDSAKIAAAETAIVELLNELNRVCTDTPVMSAIIVGTDTEFSVLGRNEWRPSLVEAIDAVTNATNLRARRIFKAEELEAQTAKLREEAEQLTK